MIVQEENSDSALWSRQQDKAFENAIAIHTHHPEQDRWHKIAADVPGKTIQQVRDHYQILLEDINQIESGRVPLPSYTSSSEASTAPAADHANGKKAQSHNTGSDSKASRADQERRKGIAWTEDEHRLFLLGLDKYGKGDWRSISRNFVVTRTPTQVASHAQKYFIRLNSMNKERRRSSIHDITSVNGAGDVTTPQGPITGQTNAGALPLPSSGQPSDRPFVSAIGTPANVTVAPHMAYGVRVPSATVGTPVSLPMPPHPSTPR